MLKHTRHNSVHISVAETLRRNKERLEASLKLSLRSPIDYPSYDAEDDLEDPLIHECRAIAHRNEQFA